MIGGHIQKNKVLESIIHSASPISSIDSKRASLFQSALKRKKRKEKGDESTPQGKQKSAPLQRCKRNVTFPLSWQTSRTNAESCLVHILSCPTLRCMFKLTLILDPSKKKLERKKKQKRCLTECIYPTAQFRAALMPRGFWV